MKKTHRLFSLLLTVLMLCALTVPAFALVDPPENEYVADYANVLSSKTEQMIIDENGELDYYCGGAQIVVVTIDYLEDGYDAQQYANQLFNDWGVGNAKKDNNGMLLLLVTQEYKGWLVQGAGITSSLSNKEINNMMDQYFWDYVDNNQYEEAVTSLFEQLIRWYESEYNVQIPRSANNTSYNNNYNGNYNNGYYENRLTLGDIIKFLIIFILAVNFLSAFMRPLVRRRRGNDIPFWLMWMFCNDRGPRGPRGPMGPGPGGFGGGGFGGSGFGGGGFSGGGGHSGGGFGGGFSGGGGGGRR